MMLPATPDSTASFAQALKRAGQTGLFTQTERRLLATACVVTFALPILISLLALNLSARPLASLNAKNTQVADLLVPTSGRLASNDEPVMAQYLSGTNPEAPETLAPQRVAAPAPTHKQALTGTTASNAQNDSVVLPAGTTSLFVPYKALKNDSQIYLTPEGNADNAVIYVKQKTVGTGFTLAATAPIQRDLTITWYDIGTP